MKITTVGTFIFPLILMGCSLLGGRDGGETRELVTRGAPLCGSPDNHGEPVGRVASATHGCGIADAVREISVSAMRWKTG